MSDAAASQAYPLKEAFRRGAILAARNALIGSALFALVDIATAVLMDLGEPSLGVIFSNLLTWFLLLAAAGSIVTLIPAALGGSVLGLLILARGTIQRRQTATLVGALLGAMIVSVISLPNLYIALAAHDQWSLYNNPGIPVYVERLVVAVLIASILGGYTGRQLFEKRENPCGNM